MNKLTMFHIGDVHYPDLKGQTIADEKDKGLDGQLMDKISPDPLTLVMKNLAEQSNKCSEECLFLLSGDITSKGDEENYKVFVENLNELLLLDRDISRIHVVPGNHDIKQELVEQNQQYTHMIETWNTVCEDYTILAHDSVREEIISMGENTEITVFSLNTCVGCGGKRKIVGELKSQMLKSYKSETTKVHDLYEKLDTPAVDTSHLDDIVFSINKASRGKNIPVILAHHNLLPQRDPRIEIYTELINSGSMREYLLEANGPLLLCHGHIHDDPIEIVTSPQGKGAVIILSAPEIIKGFNSITFFVGKKGYFLGCIVEHHRLKRGGGVFVEASYSIPFCQPSDFFTKGDERISECLGGLQCNKLERGSDYLNRLKTERVNYQKKTVQEVLEEAMWFGLVDITNKDKVEFDDWHIKKVVP